MKQLNIFHLLFFATLIWLLPGCSPPAQEDSEADEDSVAMAQPEQEGPADNALTEEERQEGWELLFDGQSLDKWRGHLSDSLPASSWSVADGEVIVKSSGGAESEAGGDIITRKQYGAFELSVDFMLTPGANSGIKYYVVEGLNQGSGSAIGLEYQLLDDAEHPDAKMGRDGNRTLASLYDLMTADPAKPVNPPGEWNTAVIKSDGSHVEHWLNGTKVLEYERGSEDYRALVAKSKYTPFENFGEAATGHILLQEHGDEVHFKNIKIKDLSNQ